MINFNIKTVYFQSKEDIKNYVNSFYVFFAENDIDTLKNQVNLEIDELEKKINVLYEKIDNLELEKWKLELEYSSIFDNKSLHSDFNAIQEKLKIINLKIDKNKDAINSSNIIMNVLNKDMSILMSEIKLINQFNKEKDKEKINKAILKLSKRFLNKLNYQLLKIYINN